MLTKIQTILYKTSACCPKQVQRETHRTKAISQKHWRHFIASDIQRYGSQTLPYGMDSSQTRGRFHREIKEDDDEHVYTTFISPYYMNITLTTLYNCRSTSTMTQTCSQCGPDPTKRSFMMKSSSRLHNVATCVNRSTGTSSHTTAHDAIERSKTTNTTRASPRRRPTSVPPPPLSFP